MAGAVRLGLRILSNPAWRGGINYVLNWAKACASLPLNERPSIFLLYADARGLDLAEELRPLVTGIYPFQSASALDLDLVYPATQIFEAPFDTPWAGWIPDWQCKHLPEMFDPLELARRSLHYGILATRAPFVVLSSQMALNDSLRLFGSRITRHARLPFPSVLDQVELSAPVPLQRFGLPNRYLLVCNQWWRHKNHKAVIEALALVRDLPICCVFTGETVDPRWPDHFSELQSLIRNEGLRSHVRILGSIDRLEQIGLMRHAVAIIQPSRFEGWSTVVEEGRALGSTMLLSSFPVHMEQSPPGALFFDPDSPAELAELIRAVWSRSAGDHSIRSPNWLPNGDYVLSCARALVHIAREARTVYRPDLHDPKVILLDLLRANPGERGNEVEARLHDRFVAGCRSMFRADPAQLAAFERLCNASCSELVGAMERLIVAPVLAKMTFDQRSIFAKARAKPPVSSPRRRLLDRTFRRLASGWRKVVQ